MHSVHPRTVHYSWKQRLTFSVSAQILPFLVYLRPRPKNPLLSLLIKLITEAYEGKKVISGTHLSSGRELWNSNALRAKSEWKMFDRTDPRPVIQSAVCPQNLIRCLMHDSLWITQFSKGETLRWQTGRERFEISIQPWQTSRSSLENSRNSVCLVPAAGLLGGKRSHQPFTSLLISTGVHAVKHF